jgi:cystathionine gamma-synthase
MLSLTSHRRQETPCSSRTNAGDTFTSDELATVEQLLEVAPQERAELDRGGTLSESDGNGRGEAEGVAAAAPAATEGMDRQRARLIQDARSSTRAVHGGERAKGGKKAKATADSLTTPIVQSSTFTFRNTRECIQYNLGKYSSFEYGRYGNPTTRAAEEKLIDLECGNLAQQDAHPDSAVYDALLSASGMNAVTTMLFALFALDNADVRGAGLGTTVSEKGTGGCLITTTDCYRRTRQFIEEMMPRLNVRVVIMDPSDLALLESTLREIRESTDGAITQQRVVFFSESPTNPLLRLVDVPRIVALARQYDMMVCIDSTFATPINHRPLELGADLVLHSATKYLGGHNDILAGALIGRAELIAKVRRAHGILGGVIDPHTSYLLLRGLKTLKIRVDAHNQNAAALAHRLANDERIACVHWPGLPEHPDYHLGRRLHEAYAQFRAADGGCGFGGVLSFELRGHLRGGADDPYGAETFRRTGKFIDALRIPYIGPSLGGTETLVEQVCIMGYFDQPLWRRRRLGITCGLVRFSCGIEDAEDIVQDVMHALDVAFEDTYV